MPNRTWSGQHTIVAAFIFAAALGAALGTIAYREYRVGRDAYGEYQRKAYADQREATSQIARRCATYGPPPEAIRRCIAEAVRAYDAERDTNEDLKAQKDMAFWSKWMLIVSGIGLGFSFVGLVALMDSLNQTRSAIRNDREVGQAQVRAYLTVESAAITAHPHDAGVFWDLQVRISNSGQSPAKKIEGYAINADGSFSADHLQSLRPGDQKSLNVGVFVHSEDLYFTNVTQTIADVRITLRIKYKDIFMRSGEFMEERVIVRGDAYTKDGAMSALMIYDDDMTPYPDEVA